ncbi:MAG: lipopolysaccharide biosynthesis protein, partial [Polyangiaceae bacterium]
VRTLGNGFWVIVSQMAVMIGNGADLLVIAAVLGPAIVTPYTITDKLVTMANNVPLMIMAAAQPALSELSTRATRLRLSDVCVSLTRVVLLVSGLIAIVVVVVDQGFVGWWIGPHEFGGRGLVYLLVADMVLGHWAAATAYALFSFGYERLISIASILGWVVMVGGTVLFSHHFGSMGAPLASIGSRVLIALPILLFAAARATGGTVKGLLWSVFPWLWRLGLLMAAAVWVTRVWVPRSIVALCGAGAAAVLVYAVVMAPLAFYEPLGSYTRPRFAALRRRIGQGA